MAAQRSIQSMVDAARFIAKDTLVPTRYRDEDFLEGFNQAMALIRKNRPDAFMRTAAVDIGEWKVDQLDTNFPLDIRFTPAVISYMVGWVDLSEDQYSNEGRAAGLLQRFSAQLMMLGA